MLCHPPTKVLKCKRSLSTDGFVWELWQRWLRMSSSRQFPHRLFLFCPLLCSDMPLLADCCFMYYLLGQPQIKLSRVSPFFCHPPTATSHATPGEEPWMSNVAFFSANVRDISAYSVWPNVGDAERKMALMRPPSAPRGQRGSWWAVETI